MNHSSSHATTKPAESLSKTSYSNEWVLMGQAYSLPLRGLLVAFLAVLAGLSTSFYLIWFPPLMFAVAALLTIVSVIILFLCAKSEVKVNLGTNQAKVGGETISLNGITEMVYYHDILKIIVKTTSGQKLKKTSYEIKIPVGSLSKEKLAIVRQVVLSIDPNGVRFPASKRILQDISAAFPVHPQKS